MIILRNRLRIFTKTWIIIFLMMGLSNTYAKKQSSMQDEEVMILAEESACQADRTCETTRDAIATVNIGSACSENDSCDIASSASEDAYYGGIEREYVVKGCKVTIYNDGPVKMVNEKTDKPCNAPIPKDHKFSKKINTYEDNGCIITESVAADGIIDAIKDCSNKNNKK